jgi:hypothetical protein
VASAWPGEGSGRYGPSRYGAPNDGVPRIRKRVGGLASTRQEMELRRRLRKHARVLMSGGRRAECDLCTNDVRCLVIGGLNADGMGNHDHPRHPQPRASIAKQHHCRIGDLEGRAPDLDPLLPQLARNVGIPKQPPYEHNVTLQQPPPETPRLGRRRRHRRRFAHISRPARLLHGKRPTVSAMAAAGPKGRPTARAVRIVRTSRASPHGRPRRGRIE